MARFTVAWLACGFVMAIVFMAASKSREPKVSAVELENAPLALEVSTVGRFAEGRSWHLSVNSAGSAELTINTFPESTHKRFQATEEQLAKFRKALREERFLNWTTSMGSLYRTVAKTQ
jgi:hypothetical protein